MGFMQSPCIFQLIPAGKLSPDSFFSYWIRIIQIQIKIMRGISRIIYLVLIKFLHGVVLLHDFWLRVNGDAMLDD